MLPPISPDQVSDLTQYEVRVGNQLISYYSKAGYPEWEGISPAQQLLAENVEIKGSGGIYILGCGNGAWIKQLLSRIGPVPTCITDLHIQALVSTFLTLESNSTSAQINPSISLLPGKLSEFEHALICMPKGRTLTRRWLVETFYCLNPGGTLYLAGANDLGVKSIQQDCLDLFGNCSVVRYHKGNRLLKMVRLENKTAPPAWININGLAPGTWHLFTYNYQSEELTLKTLPGVFSWEAIDPGSKLLLDYLLSDEYGNVLDYGCGCGIIGLTLAMKGAAQVDMVDSSTLAVAATNINIKDQNLSNVRVFLNDSLLSVQEERYDLIVSNPPFHVGKKVDSATTLSFLKASSLLLKPKGRLVIVANQFLPYERLLRHTFSSVECPVFDGKYRIWSARNY